METPNIFVKRATPADLELIVPISYHLPL